MARSDEAGALVCVGARRGFGSPQIQVTFAYWMIFHTLVLSAALSTALIAGVFLAFSTFVMKALRRLPPAQGIAAMQAINIAVINPLFLGVFLGAAGLCVANTIIALMHWSGPASVYVITGSVIYLVGTFGVTMAGNVPLNNALAGLDPASPEAAERWTDYVRVWGRWNHVRTVAGLAAAGVLIWG